jgi:hypothetical protein
VAWEQNARRINNGALDRIVEVIAMVAELRAEEKEEATITLAIGEKVQLLNESLTLQIDGHEVY